MNGINKAVLVAVVATLGLWGCAKGPTGGSAERIKALESKVAKLEEDFKAAAGARDSLRQRLTSVEEQRARLEAEVARLPVVTKERDDLKNQVTTRTTERDAVQVQFEQFRKAIRELVGQADIASQTPAANPATVSAPVLTPGKS